MKSQLKEHICCVCVCVWSDLFLWFRTPSPLPSFWGCACTALWRWCTQRTPEEEREKKKEPTVTHKLYIKALILSKSPSLIFPSRSKKTLGASGLFIFNFLKAAPIDTLLFSITLCKWRCAGWEKAPRPEFVSHRRLGGVWGEVRGALPWIRHGRRRSGRCISVGFSWLARGHRRTDMWAGRWSSARPVGKHTHTQTMKTGQGKRK